MHYLQKSILDALRYQQPLNYTALIPEGIESSHFRYHLKLLMTDGLIYKDAAGLYALSDKGQREVDYLSENRTTTVRTPKVITYTLLRHKDMLLLYKKPKEPYRNLWGLIGGKVHFGEDAQHAAQREVLEKTGLQVNKPRLCGAADIRIDKDGETLSHVTAYVHVLELDILPVDMPAGLRAIAANDIHSYDVMPDLRPLLEAIDTAEKPFVVQFHCPLHD